MLYWGDTVYQKRGRNVGCARGFIVKRNSEVKKKSYYNNWKTKFKQREFKSEGGFGN